MDKILLMLQLQNQLNDATNGEDWVRGVTKNGRQISWRRCIYMECAEMIDSFSWKHWKSLNQEADWANLQIEVVDVWHFVMSLAIEHYNKNMLGNIEDLAMNIDASKSCKRSQNAEKNFATQDRVIEKVEDIMRLSLSQEKLDLEGLIENFFELVLMSGLEMKSLYKLYVGKNVLNQFRQDHGYKEGSYIKVWNGEEDNVVMKRIWEEHPNLAPDMLYRELTKHYHALTKA